MVIVIKKKNITNYIILTMITIISLIATSGTYAKYTSSVETESSCVTVAKWSVKINDKDITQTQEAIAFDIFDTIYDSDGTSIEYDIANVDSTSDPNKNSIIAPGTSGAFNLKIENESEVNIKYSIEFTEDNTSRIPIEYSVNGVDYFDVEGLTNALNTRAENIAIGGLETIEVSWRWAYESDGTNSYGQTDETDTALGTFSTSPIYNVSAKIIVTQVD